ncbi:bifunctional metallophosphatase/5'-nucleotidase [Haladaptatus sp. CMSO5]|uniref:bifunctional metallophosphatase/5'-nucleotidase n=1 Tax=Haladaptatus sp. CMSO5 TaxID=3120514 RepID=UPI002FCE3356
MTVRLLHYSDIENIYDDPARAGRLAGLIDAQRDEETLVLGTGDNTAPGVLSLVTEGRQALSLFRAIEPDAETFGNHDFDYGPEATLDVVRASPQTWVNANTWDGDDLFGKDDGVVPHTVVTVGDTHVGLFGVTDPATPSLTPRAAALTFTDPIEAAKEAVAALTEAGVDHIVALSHLGGRDEELAVSVDVDVILGGHIHTERIERIDGTLLTRPGVNGEVLLEVELDEKTVTRHEVADGPRDNAVTDSLRSQLADAGVHEVVGHVTEPLERTERTAFRGESRVGNFVADAYRWAGGADVGLQNSGGIRSGPALSGDVTVRDLISLVPFDEAVAVIELTGEELEAVFEQANGGNVDFGEPHWWHGHVSGARLVYDHAAGELASATVDGEPIDSEATYTLATTEYLLHASHEFPVLSAELQVDRLDTQYEVLAEYARTEGLAPTVEGRISRTGV